MLDAPLGTHYTANILTIIGLIIVVAFLGSKALQRLGIPQVVGFIVIGVVTATTFVVQMIGPIDTKLAISRAGEI